VVGLFSLLHANYAVGPCNSHRYRTFHDTSLGLQEGGNGYVAEFVGGGKGPKAPQFWGLWGAEGPKPVFNTLVVWSFEC
jgi:hypothetical protein